MTTKINAYLSMFLLATITACGGTPKKTKKPTDVTAGVDPNDGQASADAVLKSTAPIKRKRTLSADVKEDFKKLVKKYQAAKKSGLADQCSSLASEFASLWASNSKVTEAKFNEGAVLLECGKVAEAERSFKELLAKAPKHGAAINNLGFISWKRGQYGQALTYFERAAKAGSSEGYSNLAMNGRNRGVETSGDDRRRVLREALGNVRRALAVDSSNINAYEIQAAIVVDHAKSASKLEIARLTVVQAIKRDPRHAPLYNVLGLILLKMGEMTRALKQFRKAVSYDKTLLEAHMNIGAITLNFRDYRAAAKAFTTVLEDKSAIKKMRFDATVGLGVAQRGQKKFDKAMERYQQALKMDPTQHSIAYNIGILLQDHMFDASSPEAAIKTLKEASSYLQRYVGSGHRAQRKDAQRRLKNIREMIPMLMEQQKMMAEMRKQQAAEKKGK